MSEINKSRYRSREEKEALIKEWMTSGVEKKEFCSVKGLNYNTFISWKFAQAKNSESLSRFVPVQIEHSAKGIFAEIELSNSRRIIFHQPVGFQLLQQLLKC
jgi:hypothetical protein